jgi:lanosterol synthase
MNEPQVTSSKKSKTNPPEARGPLARAVEHLASIQHDGGFWEGEMVWNTMLLSQWVIVQKIVGRPIGEERRRRILRSYEVTRLADGSWPMHGEGEGYVFFTALAYVALRLLGLPPEHPLIAPARVWLHATPDRVLGIASWGKFWLSMLGLYEYEGMNPVPPEIFLLPESVPLHPNNYYCHTRYIYLGIGYLYGKRFRADLGPITAALREELYDTPYARIDFAAHRHDIGASDLYVRPSLPLRVAYDALIAWEHAPELVRKPVRRRALALCESRILYEQMASRRQGISPVNGLLNCLSIYAIDPQHAELAPSLDAMESWAWEDEEEGLRFCGAHSTAWDTAFSIRAISAAAAHGAIAPAAKQAVRAAYRWLEATQMQEELPDHERERRAPIRGGWCFSDGKHRWPVSDCTAEALTAILEAEATGLVVESERIARSRLGEAVTFILRRQNEDGGFGSYEARRAGGLLELVNPSELYGNCMTERSYTECTASCVGALVRWLRAEGRGQPDLGTRVEAAVARAVALLRSRQLPDGSYLGFWGVNFTYGIFHVVEALVTAGVSKRAPAIARALSWLVVHQKDDGGWGEHWKSCLTDTYVEHPESQPAMTAWALLALAEGDDPASPEHAAVARAIEQGRARLTAMQGANGAWPHKAQSGVFFSTAMLDYRLYKDMFPTWALSRTG